MAYWLFKSEPFKWSWDDQKEAGEEGTQWTGIRNYQARNSIRDVMSKGDLAFFYHSNCDEPGIAGIVTIAAAGYPDPSQFDKKDKYYDEKSTEQEPRWYSFDVKFKKKLKTYVNLADLKSDKKLTEMKVVQKGQRLSIQPVTEKEWKEVCKMAEA